MISVASNYFCMFSTITCVPSSVAIGKQSKYLFNESGIIEKGQYVIGNIESFLLIKANVI